MAVLSMFPRLSYCREIQGGDLWVEFRNLCTALYTVPHASYSLCVIGYIRFAFYRWNYQNYPLLQEMTVLFHGNLEGSPNMSPEGKGRSLIIWVFTKTYMTSSYGSPRANLCGVIGTATRLGTWSSRVRIPTRARYFLLAKSSRVRWISNKQLFNDYRAVSVQKPHVQ